MKLTVKTLKGSHFDIRVQPIDTPEQEMPHTISNTPAEQEAIARAFLAFGRNEELAGNYLLEHAGDEE